MLAGKYSISSTCQLQQLTRNTFLLERAFGVLQKTFAKGTEAGSV